MSNPDKLNLSHLANKDHAEGQAELLKQLKTTQASDLHNMDPALLARLTATQRQELFAKRSPNYSSGFSSYKTKNIKLKSTHKRPGFLRRFWYRLPILIRSQCIGAVAALILVSAGLVLMKTWPG